jgi:hypothetical protein
MTVAHNSPNDPDSPMTAPSEPSRLRALFHDSAYDLLKANGRKSSRRRERDKSGMGKCLLWRLKKQSESERESAAQRRCSPPNGLLRVAAREHKRSGLITSIVSGPNYLRIRNSSGLEHTPAAQRPGKTRRLLPAGPHDRRDSGAPSRQKSRRIQNSRFQRAVIAGAPERTE